MTRSDGTFDAYIITAPSLWWNDFEILANAHVLNGDVAAAEDQYRLALELTVASINGQGNADRYREQLDLLSDPVQISDAGRQRLSGCYGDGDEYYVIHQADGRLHGRQGGGRQGAGGRSVWQPAAPSGHGGRL